MESAVARHACKAKSSIFKYDTNKMVEINSKKIGIMSKVLAIVIIAYAIGYVMIYMKGYQESYTLTSSVVTKVKGLSKLYDNSFSRKLWDIPDLVVPSQEKGAVFITTNAVITEGQTQRMCPEASDVYSAGCKSDSDCVKEQMFFLGNGIRTGRCVPNGHVKTCEIDGWCPLENDALNISKPPLTDIHGFTLFIKNTIIFDTLNIKRSNLFLWNSGRIPKNCVFDPTHALLKYCPIFNVSSILGPMSKKEFSELLTYGAIVQVIITWNCNMDFKTSDCMPEYTFNRLDSANGKLSKGWNFRYANYYYYQNIETRDLYKVFGLRILIEVRGQAGKFSLISFSMNAGSSISLLAIASVVCDFLIVYVMPNKDKYRQTIFERHFDDDAYEELEERTEYKGVTTPMSE